ncbi:hypothetical protein BLA29_015552 [Euroglyphus maynei]
MNEGT